MAVNMPLVSIAPCRLSVPLQVAEPKFSSTNVWLKLKVLPFSVITSGKMSEPLSIAIVPFSSTVIVTGIVLDSVRPSAEAVAVAVPT